MKVTAATAALLLTSAAAVAQPVSGFYVQGSAGLALPQQQSISLPPAMPVTPGKGIAESPNAAINGGLGR